MFFTTFNRTTKNPLRGLRSRTEGVNEVLKNYPEVRAESACSRTTFVSYFGAENIPKFFIIVKDS